MAEEQKGEAPKSSKLLCPILQDCMPEKVIFLLPYTQTPTLTKTAAPVSAGILPIYTLASAQGTWACVTTQGDFKNRARGCYTTPFSTPISPRENATGPISIYLGVERGPTQKTRSRHIVLVESPRTILLEANSTVFLLRATGPVDKEGNKPHQYWHFATSDLYNERRDHTRFSDNPKEVIGLSDTIPFTHYPL